MRATPFSPRVIVEADMPKSAVVAAVLGFFSLLMGLVVLVGWHARVPILIQLRPDFAPMQYNTALCFLLGGIAVVAAATRKSLVTRMAGTVVTAVGLLTLAEYAWRDLGIDQLLFRSSITTHVSHPGRMSPISALCFALCGVALILISNSRSRRWAPALSGLLSSAAIALALVAVLGYATNLTGAYGWGQLARMALHTAVGFCLLGNAIFALAWSASSTGSAGTPRWLPCFVGLAGLTVAIGLSQALSVEQHARAERTLQAALATRSEALPEMQSNLPTAVLIAGVVGAGLLALTVFLAQAGLARARDLVAANEALQREMAERKRAEEGEARFAAILEATTDFVGIAAPSGKVLYVNRAGRELAGVHPATDVTSTSFVDYYTTEARKLINDEGVPTALREGSWHGETSLLDRDGKIVLVSHVILAHRDADGTLKYLSSVMRDITERKAMVEALIEARQHLEQRVEERTKSLQASEQRYRFLADAMPQIIWTAKPDGNIDYYNQRWYDYTGLTFEDTRDWGWQPVLHPDDLQNCVDRWTHSFRTGADYQVEYRFKRAADGSYRWHLGRAFPLRDDAGTIVQWVGTCTDIDDQKRTQEELRQARTQLEMRVTERTAELKVAAERLGLATRAASVGVWDWDVVNNSLLWEDEMYRLYRIAPDQFGSVYDAWLERLHPDDMLRLHDEIQLALRGEKDYDTEFRILWPDRSVHHIQANAIVLRDDSGTPIRMLGTNWDVTSRKDVESELVKAKNTAEAATRAKSEFLAVMSHEIRTPMNGVMGMTGLLLDTKLDDRQRRYAETIQSSADSLLTVINDILDFSKIEAGKLAFETLDFDLRDAIEGTLELMAERASSKRIELLGLIDPEVKIQLRGDSGRLHQVLMNLVGNAVKFTEKGEVIVRVSLSEETENDVTLRFEVQDTGIGISEDAQASLFQPFRQADGSTTRRYGGTGLGLAIARQLVELMHGQIGVTSAPGHGSTFHFTVCLEKQAPGAVESQRCIATTLADEPRALQARVIHPAEPTSERNRGVKILIAEDNAINQQVAVEQLRKLGYAADTVANGLEVIEALRRIPYDIVLMDCMMPELDGFGATIEIRRLEEQRAPGFEARLPVHVIAITANAMQGDREACLAAGMNDYVTKPVRSSELKRAVERGIDNLSMAQEEEEEAMRSLLSPASANEPPVDLERLMEISSGDPGKARRLVGMYLKQADEMMLALDVAIQQGVASETRHLAHKLGGSSSTCGMSAVVPPLAQLESLGRSGKLSGAVELHTEVGVQLHRLRQFLDETLEVA